MTTDKSRAAVRVCAIADIECSRGCGAGACKREQPAPCADALTEAERLLLARVNDCTKPIDAADRNGILKLIDRLAACPVEQPAAAPIDTPTDREFALSAAICVHPKGVYGDEGGSMCCPITHTRDASFAPAPADEQAAYHFHRFVDGVEMAEGVLIERAPTLEAAIKEAVRCCEKRPMTVLVHAPAWAGTLCGGALANRAAFANETGAEGAEPMAIPAGWKLVPVAPTFEMCRAMEEAIDAGWKDSIVWARGIAAAPQPPAQADAREGLTDEQRSTLESLARTSTPYEQEVLRSILAAHPGQPVADDAAVRGDERAKRKAFTAVFLDVTTDEAREIVNHPKWSAGSWSHALDDRDAARAELARAAFSQANPGQPEPRAEVTDEQIADMFERVTGYSLENGRAALNDADILGFARELLEAAAADKRDALDTLVAVLNAIGYTEEFAAAHPDMKVSEGVALFLSQRQEEGS